MPYSRVDDVDKLRRLLGAVLLIAAEVDLTELLRRIVHEAVDLVGARYGALGVLDPTHTYLEQFLTVGLSPDEEMAIGSRPTGHGVLGRLISDPEPLRVRDVGEHPRRSGFPAQHPPMNSFLGVPIRTRGEVYGNLYLTNKVEIREFTAEDEALAEALALAAGVAIENTRLRSEAARTIVLDERDRIARDLHDRVIQRIYAVGLMLHGASSLPDRDSIASRVDRAVDDLDVTMTEIRTSIFELGARADDPGLRATVSRIAHDVAPVLGRLPSVIFDGPVDTEVRFALRDHVMAVVREGLTNVARHADADAVSVRISVDDRVTVEIRDDGRGATTPTMSSGGLGLENLRHRAEDLSGSCVLEHPTTGGTRLVWSVPNT